MPINIIKYKEILSKAKEHQAILVAVSKTKPTADIQELYALGQRDFGENYVQEFLAKKIDLPKDIRWHFIGHLQTNKVKQIIPFTHLIHGVDSIKLLQEINKEAGKLNIKVACLLQMHIAKEATKFGLEEHELDEILKQDLPHVIIDGVMGMASFVFDDNIIMKEFHFLHHCFVKVKNKYPQAKTLSMGMSDDYELALFCGSNMLRIGSIIFGSRQ